MDDAAKAAISAKMCLSRRLPRKRVMNASSPDVDGVDFSRIFDAPAVPSVPAVDVAAQKKLEAETEIGLRTLARDGAYVRLVTPGAVPVIAPVSPRVLVVEDDVGTANLIERVLVKGGYTVIRAHHRAEIVAALNQAVPDLVLLDVMLPDANGFDVLTRIRAHRKLAEVPVMMLTSLDSADDVGQGLALGVNGYLSKPISPATLLASIHECLGD